MIKKSARGWLEVLDLEQGTETFDREFWAAQTPEMRMMAGWEMSKLAYLVKGVTEDELRLCRVPIVVQPIER